MIRALDAFSGLSILGLGSSARKSSFRVTFLEAVCGAIDDRLLGDDPMLVLKGDLAEGGGKVERVERRTLRLSRNWVGSGAESGKC